MLLKGLTELLCTLPEQRSQAFTPVAAPVVDGPAIYKPALCQPSAVHGDDHVIDLKALNTSELEGLVQPVPTCSPGEASVDQRARYQVFKSCEERGVWPALNDKDDVWLSVHLCSKSVLIRSLRA